MENMENQLIQVNKDDIPDNIYVMYRNKLVIIAPTIPDNPAPGNFGKPGKSGKSNKSKKANNKKKTKLPVKEYKQYPVYPAYPEYSEHSKHEDNNSSTWEKIDDYILGESNHISKAVIDPLITNLLTSKPFVELSNMCDPEELKNFAVYIITLGSEIYYDSFDADNNILDYYPPSELNLYETIVKE